MTSHSKTSVRHPVTTTLAYSFRSGNSYLANYDFKSDTGPRWHRDPCNIYGILNQKLSNYAATAVKRFFGSGRDIADRTNPESGRPEIGFVVRVANATVRPAPGKSVWTTERAKVGSFVIPFWDVLRHGTMSDGTTSVECRSMAGSVFRPMARIRAGHIPPCPLASAIAEHCAAYERGGAPDPDEAQWLAASELMARTHSMTYFNSGRDGKKIIDRLLGNKTK